MSTIHPQILAALTARVAATSSGFTLPTPLPALPFPLLQEWLSEETRAKRTPNPNAMSLATIDSDGTLSNRIVLCRGLNVEHGIVTFFTNYRGRKGRALLREGWGGDLGESGERAQDAPAPQQAAVCFHWDTTDRQARVEGLVVPSSSAESDAYFASRRWESRLAAWASDQSEPIASREHLLAKLADVCDRLQLDPQQLLDSGNNSVIPRPPHWGGFRLHARCVELWMGGPGRMHDRAIWKRTLPTDLNMATQDWSATRLQP